MAAPASVAFLRGRPRPTPELALLGVMRFSLALFRGRPRRFVPRALGSNSDAAMASRVALRFLSSDSYLVISASSSRMIALMSLRQKCEPDRAVTRKLRASSNYTVEVAKANARRKQRPLTDYTSITAKQKKRKHDCCWRELTVTAAPIRLVMNESDCPTVDMHSSARRMLHQLNSQNGGKVDYGYSSPVVCTPNAGPAGLTKWR